MYWNSSEHWHEHRHGHGHRHHGSGWLVPVVIIGLIILTHGWILILPLMLLAGFAFFAVLPKVMYKMRQNGWDCGEWSREWQEKHKRHFQDWGGRYDEKPKRDNPDHIDYV